MDAAELIRAYRKSIPDLHDGAYRRGYDKAMAGKSLRAAINAKCLDCCCWQKSAVRDCSVVTCPLHPHRPYQTTR